MYFILEFCNKCSRWNVLFFLLFMLSDPSYSKEASWLQPSEQAWGRLCRTHTDDFRGSQGQKPWRAVSFVDFTEDQVSWPVLLKSWLWGLWGGGVKDFICVRDRNMSPAVCGAWTQCLQHHIPLRQDTGRQRLCNNMRVWAAFIVNLKISVETLLNKPRVLERSVSSQRSPVRGHWPHTHTKGCRWLVVGQDGSVPFQRIMLITCMDGGTDGGYFQFPHVAPWQKHLERLRWKPGTTSQMKMML